jgi:hypothetical protein
MADQIVSLTQVKQWLTVSEGDTSQDAKLSRLIDSATPMIEAIVGPVVVRTFDEWYDGGSDEITLRRRPSRAIGTSPILTLVSVTEYRGAIAYPLTIVTDPGMGDTYSVMLSESRLTRRYSGGGYGSFPPGPDTVHVIYQAGQATVPANIVEAAWEIVRVNYWTTQSVGTGRMTVADSQDAGVELAAAMPPSARRMLSPNRKAPSCA